MDILLSVIGCLCLLIGLIGCIVPALPGPPVSYLGILFIHWTSYAHFSTAFLVIWAVIAAAVTVLDNFLPIWMTKKFGGSRAATIGSGIGLVAGLFFAPWGIILGPFLGALIGELIHDHADSAKAFKVALSSFASFMLGTGLKLIVSGMLLFYGVRGFFL